MFYWFLRWIALGPVLRLVFRPTVEGMENVPADGPAILASNHLSYADWLFMPLTLNRKVTFVAKAEYFTTPGIKGWLQKTFFSGAGQVPIDRSGRDAAAGALLSAKRVLDEGGLFGIYPEGTRSHDGRLYRGKTGVAKLAIETGVPVIPVAVVGTDVVAPPGKKFGRWTRPHVRFGKPLDFSRYEGLENDRFILRSATDEVMYEIMRLSGQEYVDMYATRAKALEKEASRRPTDDTGSGTGGGTGSGTGGGTERAQGVLTMPLQPAPQPGAVGPSPAAAADQVETTLLRALGVLRLVVLVYAVVLNSVRFEEFTRPRLVVVLLGVMVAWTAFAIWAYDAPGRRRLPLFVADLAVAVALLLFTPLVQSEAMLDRHASTVPTFWVIPAVLAWAVGRHWSQALGAAAVVSVADLSVRTAAAGRTWGNIFLLLLAAGVVAYSARTLRVAVEMRARAEREAAAIAERVRLSRAVHDGVLQVLALVQRRGTEAGGDLAELGRLAGEQEAALRALVQAHERTGSSTGEAQAVDLLGLLPAAPYTVSGPGRPVPLPSDRAHELAAVVAACLDNVRRHVGTDAPAWILVEDLGDAVAVTVRDEGPGIPEGRLAQAAREGRLGVRQSIQGRIADLGGEARLVTAPGQGTEWELVVPRG